MRKCQSCDYELNSDELTAENCPNCGALLRRLAQRTIDDSHLSQDDNRQTIGVDDLTFDPNAKESIELELTEDDDPGNKTIDLGSQRTMPSLDDIDAGQTIEIPSAERKSPTIADQSDRTMEFDTFGSIQHAGEEPPTKRVRRSTHSLESDKTIDLDMPPAEVRKLDSQWRDTVEPGARQGQTIRQHETVTGFRSSLPVKSRYVREKRKTPEPAPKSLADVPDYELLNIIGEGGMGVVYAAHQSSIARTVAVKMLKPSAKVREDQRDKFISEAVVTGELDHPNIVPIYDLGSNDEGALFYSMKRVRGTPWDKVILQKQLDENLSILLRVADAVAFAHAGGVIHRDLKPENVMLGDYGEVLVMDWGLARITPEFAHVDTVYQSDSLGGTPAYMSPEMARGPVEAINKTSDVYLLGAILYEIIGGVPPHSGRDVMQCLMAASQNKIDPIRYDGELKTIALKAMATRQEDRYQTVKEFQEAIRVYQSHSESLVLTAHANQNLQRARESNDYQLYARALYGFQESLNLWDGNHRARTLLRETQYDYATCALNNGDLDLAASLLDTSHEDQQALATKIDAARKERDARQRRLRLAKQAVAALIVGIIGTVTTGLVLVNAQRNRAIAAREEAEEQRGIAVQQKNIADEQREEADKQRGIADDKRQDAEEQRGIAEQKQKEADEQRGIAEDKRKEAEEQRLLAEQAKQAEEYEAYIAQIGLAAAKIDENAYDYAQQLLDESQPELRNWEWGRLYHLCKLNAGNYEAAGPVDSVAYSPDGKLFVTADRGGKVTVRDAESGKVRFSVPHGQFVFSAAFSPDGKHIASGSSDRTIKIIDAANGNVLDTLAGHDDGVLTVRFSPDGKQLLSGSLDKTARLWDLATRQTLQTFRDNSWWIWAAEFSPDGDRIVTAGQDGKAVVWQKSELAATSTTPQSQAPGPQLPYSKLTEFTGHDGAIYTAKFSPRGNLIATGGYDNLVLVWNPDEVKPVDIEARLQDQAGEAANHLRLAGHEGPVRSVAFSPNGELLVSGSEDNSLRVWDVATGAGVKTLRGHGSGVRSCTFSPDGKLILSGDDQRAYVWNLAGYQEVRVLHATVFSGHEDAVLSARFSHDGKKIVTASRDRTASLWDAASGKPLQRFEEGHEFLVSSAAFFPNAKYIATGAGDNSVRLWDTTAGTQIASLAPTGRVGTLAIAPDGKWMATGSVGNEVQIWTVADNAGRLAVGDRPTAVLKGHQAMVNAIAVSPSGDLLASGDNNGRIRLWKRAADGAWNEAGELLGHSMTVTALRFTPDGSRLISASGDHTCGQWDLAVGQELQKLVLKHKAWVSALDISSDGKYALTTCDDGAATLWRLVDAKLVATVESQGKPFNAVAISPDGSTAALTSAEDKQVLLWDLSAATAGGEQQVPAVVLLDFHKLGSEVWSAQFAPDGQRLLTIGGNDAQLWKIDTRKPIVRYSPHGAVASAAISPDGKLVATGSWDHSAKIWDAATGQAIRKLERAHAGYINSVEFSPDGSQLLTASDDGTARVWDVASGQPVGSPFAGHTARLLGATFSPDATRILTVSGDKSARVWDRASGQPQTELKGHQWAVLCGQFSADGKHVITGGQDKTAIIWDAATGTPLTKLAGHTAAITSVAFSPDGTRALTGSQDNTAKLWDATTGKEILSLPGHTQEVTSVSFAPNGIDVLTSSRDGTAIIWLASDWRDQAPVAVASPARKSQQR